jgi:ribonuclease HIII
LKIIDCYKAVKKRLDNKGFKVEGHKLIQHGLQFKAVKKKKHLIRIFESKKRGIKADFSQVSDKNAKAILEQLTADIFDKYDRKNNSLSVNDSIGFEGDNPKKLVIDYLEELGAERIEKTEDYITCVYKHLSLTVTLYTGKICIQGRVDYKDIAVYNNLVRLSEGKKLVDRAKETDKEKKEASSVVVEGSTNDNKSVIGDSSRPGVKKDWADSSCRKSNGLIGIDESGKGSFYGPLVVAAVFVDENSKEKLFKLGVQDSKKLSNYKVKEYAQKIKQWCEFQVINIDSEAYNRGYEQKFSNVNKLLGWCHAAALEEVLKRVDCKNALSDKFGKESDVENYLTEISSDVNLEHRVKAENNIAVAAASILARDKFLREMERLDEKFGLDFPRGYSGNNVLEVGKKFVENYSSERLKEVAKINFRTADEILQSTSPNLFNWVS